jgi:hypothetical protein
MALRAFWLSVGAASQGYVRSPSNPLKIIRLGRSRLPGHCLLPTAGGNETLISLENGANSESRYVVSYIVNGLLVDCLPRTRIEEMRGAHFEDQGELFVHARAFGGGESRDDGVGGAA